MTHSSHQPVLLQEVIAGLNLQAGETLIDATINRGGHAKALCLFLGNGGTLLGVDADRRALDEARKNLVNCPNVVKLVRSNFRHLAEIAKAEMIKYADAILFDLGLSSEQLGEGARGFSFQHDGPLRMTLDQDAGPEATTAYDVVNNWSETHLVDIIQGFGEESFARRIAEHIVATRQFNPIETTSQLVEVIRQALPGWYKDKIGRPAAGRGKQHFATKTFQAIRMAVNDELGALREGLGAAWELLKPEGRLAVISFHSLEAREVKKFFHKQVKAGVGKWQPKKAIKPTREEVLSNPRSRSAQLRIITKIN